MNQEVQKIIFRADGNSDMGLGHIIRSLALADMLGSAFKTIFITTNNSEFVRSQAASICSECKIIVNEEDFFSELNSEVMVVVDGYHFGSDYQKKIKSFACKLIVIDDLAEGYFYADLIINQGGELIRKKYHTESRTKVLTGFDYVLLRRPFLAVKHQTRSIIKHDSVFVCMGGADPFHITSKVLQACFITPFVKKIFIVSGSAYSRRTELLELINKRESEKIIVHEENISAERMVTMINESEFAVCPSSSVALETCSVGCGLLTGTVADNQLQVNRQLVDSGCCLSVGDFKSATVDSVQSKLCQFANVELINSMIEKQCKVFDGQSAGRILREFKLLVEC